MDGSAPEVERLGPYLLLERLSPYGMVQPYLARREGGIELVVVKRLLPQLIQHPTAPQRFAREARLTRQLKNRHLVRTLDVGHANEELYIVTEFVAGVRLDLLMDDVAQRERTLPLDVVAGIALRVLDGLGYAHTAIGPDGRPLALVHRDLAPRSVTVAFNGEVKIGDFGGARSQWDSALTAPGTTVGTLAYMSPEQVAQGEVDARTDLYGFSVVLYELLTGQPMIETQNALSMLREIKDVDPIPLLDRRGDLPEQLADVVHRGLAKGRSDRWPDARAYEAALREALQAVAPMASTERLGAFVRACLPQQEAQFVELLDRVRALSASLPVSEQESPEDPAPEWAPVDDEPPPLDPTPEPSVITMPGPVVPVSAAERARPGRPRRPRNVLLGALVVLTAAVLVVALWRLLVTPGAMELLVGAPSPPSATGASPVVRSASEPEVSVIAAPPSAPAAGASSDEAIASESRKREPSPKAADPRPEPVGRPPRRSTDRAPPPPVLVPAGQTSPALVAGSSDSRPAPGSPAPSSRFAPRLAEFARRLEALRQSEDDARAFDALLLDMKRAAEGADPRIKRAVLRDLSAAERAFDVEGLAQALRRLQQSAADERAGAP